jgi:hypothetical protein
METVMSGEALRIDFLSIFARKFAKKLAESIANEKKRR